MFAPRALRRSAYELFDTTNGDAPQTFAVPIINDNVREHDEHFTVNCTDCNGATVRNHSSAVNVIIRGINDGAPLHSCDHCVCVQERQSTSGLNGHGDQTMLV